MHFSHDELIMAIPQGLHSQSSVFLKLYYTKISSDIARRTRTSNNNCELSPRRPRSSKRGSVNESKHFFRQGCGTTLGVQPRVIARKL